MSNTGGWWLTPIPGCLRSGLSWFNWWVSFAPEFECCNFCESSYLFYFSFNSDFYVSKIMQLWARNLPRKPKNWVSEEPRRKWGRGLVDRELVKPPPPPPPVILLLAVPRRLFCFGTLVILDVVCRSLSLFLLYLNIKIGKKKMLNVR